MGLIQQEIKELRQLLADVKAKRITGEELDAQIKVYSQIEKRTNQFLQSVALAAKYAEKGNNAYKRLVAANLIGDGEAIEITPTHETEKILCRAQDNVLIERGECLDYSGQEEHRFVCKGCEAGEVTKKLCLPDGV
jgi:hypothetical protein